MGAAVLGRFRMDTLAATPPAPRPVGWDPGVVRHLLPTVSDSRLLLKASFAHPMGSTPLLRIGSGTVLGRMNDTSGVFWQFHVTDLEPGRRYTLALHASDGSSLCEPWELSTLPALDSRPDRLRVLFFTCAGGVPGTYSGIGQYSGFLPTEIRNRLLRRGLEFEPDISVANGDHVYWDLHQWRGDEVGRLSARGRESDFDLSDRVLGSSNEAALKLAVDSQIVPVYGTDFRSTPVFFLQDDHDHFENDAASEEIVTFPVPWFQLQLARATQQLYYPEFLPDPFRPAGLPWSTMSDRGELSESFGTIRFGRLAEILLYDVRRTMTMHGPNAVFVDLQVEKWLTGRASSREVTHLVHAPSNPPGWTAGKWGEWYPDYLPEDADHLTTSVSKPYWQDGWLRQHDRLMASMSGMRGRIPLVVSGDLHAVGVGAIRRSGTLDLAANPINTVLSGPIGTARAGFPSAIRGVGPTPPAHLDMIESVRPVEEHGFTIADFHVDRIELRLFRWNVDRDPPEAIDSLQPFHTVALTTPG
jgi:hypothetical protein